MNNDKFIEAFSSLTENEKPDNLDRLIAEIEKQGFWVSEPFTYGDGTYGLEFGQSTPAGEDWFEHIELGDNIDYFIGKLLERVNNWDSEEEASIYIDMRGQRGVPSSIRTLIDDADWKEEQLTDLVSALQLVDFDEELDEQVKVEESENKENRKLNLMIRNATEHIDELEAAGFDVLACELETYDMGQNITVKSIEKYSVDAMDKLNAEIESHYNKGDDEQADESDLRACVWVTKSGMNKFYDVTRGVYGEADDLDSENAEININLPLPNSDFDIANYLSTPINEDQYKGDELKHNDATYDAIKYHKEEIADIEQQIADIEAQIDELHNSNDDFKNDAELERLYAELEKLSKEHLDGFNAQEYERLKDVIKSRYNN